MSIVEAFELADLDVRHKIAQEAKANIYSLLESNTLSKELDRDVHYILSAHTIAYKHLQELRSELELAQRTIASKEKEIDMLKSRLWDSNHEIFKLKVKHSGLRDGLQHILTTHTTMNTPLED